ncbi:MAG: YgjV family protein [Bacilli bacterium]|nr:YgjV family protein [Bacilli bacterium]
MFLIIGNIIALIASIFMVIAGLLNDRRQILVVQIIQMTLFIISNVVLGGYTAVVVNAISIVRNIVAYKGKLTNNVSYFLLVLTTIFTLIFNNHFIIGLLPLVGTIVFTLNLNNKNITKLKLALSFSMLMWLIFDLYIKSFSSALFDFLSMAAGIMTIYQIKNKKGKKDA